MNIEEIRASWDAEAATFDEEPDHGLRDPAIRAAWRGLLAQYLPSTPARVTDLGCGTGTLSVLLAEQGYAVDGIDLSPEMVERAKVKARGLPATFAVGDASRPALPAMSYDAVLCRHVLWALPDPVDALRRWVDLLAPGGLLVLVEGFWFTGAGLRAEDSVELLRQAGRSADVVHLPEAGYWGRDIDDERYLLVSHS